MNYELNSSLSNIRVSDNDPYFTAHKWNTSIAYSEAFESIISSLVGKQYKGIYKPYNEYSPGDYVWNEGKFYFIESVAFGSSYQRKIETIEVDNSKEALAFDPGIINIDKNGRIILTSEHKSKIISAAHDYKKLYHCNGSDCVVAVSEEGLYTVAISGELKQINSVVSTESVIKVVDDSFRIYIVKENILEFIDKCNVDETYVDVALAFGKPIRDLGITDDYIFVLTKDGFLETYNKKYEKLGELNVNQYIINPTRAMITSDENETVVMYNGDDGFNFFFNSSGSLEYSSFFSNPVFEAVKSISSGYGILVTTDEFRINTFNINRYVLKEVRPEMFVNNSREVDFSNSYASINYQNGYVVSDNNRLEPSTLSAVIVKNKGLTFPAVNAAIVYAYSVHFSELFVALEVPKSDGEVDLQVFYDNQLYSTTLNPSTKEQRIFMYKKDNRVYCGAYINGTKVSEKEVIPTLYESPSQIRLIATAASTTVIKSLSLLSFLPKDEIEAMSGHIFKIPIPNFVLGKDSVIRTNQNGAINVKAENGTITFGANGARVNCSSDYHSNSDTILFNTKGAKTMSDRIAVIEGKIPGFSSGTHEHSFWDLKNIPTAATNASGIVQLSASTSSTSTTLAATPSAVKSAYDLANHSHPYLSSSGGTLWGNLKVNSGRLEIGKSGTDSVIAFDAAVNDAGYILHHENNNSSIMRFVVSDDATSNDCFQWGSVPGGGYNNAMQLNTQGHLWLNGNIDVAHFNLRGDLYAGGNINVHDIYARNNINANDVYIRSDKRAKKDIKKIDDALSKIKKISGYTYSLKKDNSESAGVIAQELLDVLPNGVKMDEESGMYNVQYHAVTAMLVESIKELAAEIDEIKKWRL